jgi:hypothetical protein
VSRLAVHTAGGVRIGSDEAAVRKEFGAPEIVALDPGGTELRWRYPARGIAFVISKQHKVQVISVFEAHPPPQIVPGKGIDDFTLGVTTPEEVLQRLGYGSRSERSISLQRCRFPDWVGWPAGPTEFDFDATGRLRRLMLEAELAPIIVDGARLVTQRDVEKKLGGSCGKGADKEDTYFCERQGLTFCLQDGKVLNVRLEKKP